MRIIAIFIGCGLEVAQLLIGRDAQLGDVAADALGAFAVLAPMYVDRMRSPLRVDRRSRRVLRAIEGQGAPAAKIAA